MAVVALALPAVTGRPAPLAVPALAVVAAAALALHAAATVLVFRADRCLNLAQVSTGVLAGTVFAVMAQGRPLLRGADAVCRCLREPGEGVLAVNFLLAAVLGLLVAVAVARLVSGVVVARLRATSPVVVTVATAFVTQALVGAADRLPRLLTTEEQRQRGVLGGAVDPPVELTIRIGGTNFGLASILLVLVAAVAVGGLTVWLRRTDAGRDLRAASSDAERAATLGIDAPRASARAWMIAALLSGAAGVLVAMSGGLSALGSGGLSTALLVRILAVAVAARLTSLPLVGGAALALGLLDGSLGWVSGSAAPLDGALVLVVGGFLLLQRRARRGGDRTAGTTWAAVRAPRPVPAVLRDLPEVQRARRVLGGAAAITLAALPWLLSPAQIGLAAVFATVAVVGLSTLVVTGWAGQVSLGQVAFAAIGAAVAGATHFPLPLALVAGAGTAAGVAVAVGVPSLRLRGLEPAAVTLALALAVSAVVLNPSSLGRLVGDVGGDGLPGVDLRDPRVGWYVAAAVAAGAALVVARFRDSRIGRALVAARDDEAAAAAFGIDIVRARLAGFGAAGALAGGAGALLAHLQGSVAVESFTPEVGLSAFTITVLGGLGTTAGPLLGFAVAGAMSVANVGAGIVALVTGLGGLVLLLAAPGGLVEVAVAARDAGLRRVARRRRLDVPGLTAGTTAGVAPIAPATPVIAGAGAVPRYGIPDQWGLPEARGG